MYPDSLSPASFHSARGTPCVGRCAVRAGFSILFVAIMLGTSCGGSRPISERDRICVQAAAIRYVIAYYWANESNGPLDIDVIVAQADEDRQELVRLDEEVTERVRTFYPRVSPYSAEPIDESGEDSLGEIGLPSGGEANVFVVVGSVTRIDPMTYEVHCRWHCGRRCGGVLRLVVKGIGDRRTVTDAELEAVF